MDSEPQKEKKPQISEVAEKRQTYIDSSMTDEPLREWPTDEEPSSVELQGKKQIQKWVEKKEAELMEREEEIRQERVLVSEKIRGKAFKNLDCSTEEQEMKELGKDLDLVREKLDLIRQIMSNLSTEGEKS
jgi:hypothetical protein